MPADEFAAVVVEPIQGEGGYVVPEDDFLPRLRELCDRHGILLIADEVQSGAGRTGKMWAVQHWDVEPDILLTAKGIGSGMPVGAHDREGGPDDLGPGRARQHLRRQPGRAARPCWRRSGCSRTASSPTRRIRGREIQDALRPLLDRFPALVKDVRGKGLMIGIQFDSGETADAVQMQAFERGLLVLEAGDDCVRMSPAARRLAGRGGHRGPALRRGRRARRDAPVGGPRGRRGRAARGPDHRGLRRVRLIGHTGHGAAIRPRRPRGREDRCPPRSPRCATRSPTSCATATRWRSRASRTSSASRPATRSSASGSAT